MTRKVGMPVRKQTSLYYGFLFPTKYIEEASIGVSLPILIQDLPYDFNDKQTASFRAIVRCVLSGDMMNYKIPADTGTPIHLCINGKTRDDLRLLPKNISATVENLIFNDYGLYLIDINRSGCYIIPISDLGGIIKESGQYLFDSDVSIEGVDLTYQALTELVNEMAVDLANCVQFDEEGNVVIVGDYKTMDGLSFRSLKESVDTMGELLESSKTAIDSLLEYKDTLDSFLETWHTISDNVVVYDSDGNISAEDLEFKVNDELIDLSSFYNTFQELQEKIEDWGEVSNRLSDLEGTTEAIGDTITDVTKYLDDINQKTNEVTEQMDKLSIQFENAVMYDENRNINAEQDIYFNASSLETKQGFGQENQSLTELLQDIIDSIDAIAVPEGFDFENLANSINEHIGSTEIHVTSEEKISWDDRYSKVEIDNMLSSLESNIDWKEAVETFDDIQTTYPDPEDGWTVNVKDTNYTYRYSGSEWVAISANAIPKATNTVDGLLTSTDHKRFDDAANAIPNIQNNAEILKQSIGDEITRAKDVENGKVDKTAVIDIAHGGTGKTTDEDAINALLAGLQNSGDVTKWWEDNYIVVRGTAKSGTGFSDKFYIIKFEYLQNTTYQPVKEPGTDNVVKIDGKVWLISLDVSRQPGYITALFCSGTMTILALYDERNKGLDAFFVPGYMQDGNRIIPQIINRPSENDFGFYLDAEEKTLKFKTESESYDYHFTVTSLR